jgi:uncharacterized protein YjiS (DUF1127 family)
MNAQLVNPYGLTGTLNAGTGRDQESMIQRLVRTIVGRINEHRRYRATLDELSQLTDRELDDIGLARSEIEQVARGLCSR